MRKITVFAGLFVCFVNAGCLSYSCDGTIKYAIGRYSDKTVQRLNDYKKTIVGSIKSEKVYSRVLEEERREIEKLLARSVLENLDIKAICAEAKREKHLPKRYN